jgi:hypothetical protein
LIDLPGRVWFPCTVWYVPFVLMNLVCAFIGYWMGETRSVGPTGGMLIGFFGGPLGLIVLYTLPEIRKRASGSSQEGPAPPPPPPFPSSPAPPPAFDLEYTCPQCGKVYTHQDPSRAGAKVKCIECDTLFEIPNS